MAEAIVILLMAIAVAVLFGAGSYLLLDRDLVRMVGGTVLLSQAAILVLMSSGLLRGGPPLHPMGSVREASDPLVQALALTAVVIGFGVTAFLLAVILRVETTHHTLDVEEVEETEEAAEAEAESGHGGREVQQREDET